LKLKWPLKYFEEQDRSEFHEKLSSYSCHLRNLPRNNRVLNIEFDSGKHTDQQDHNPYNYNRYCKKKCNYNRSCLLHRMGPLSNQSIFEILWSYMHQNYHHFWILNLYYIFLALWKFRQTFFKCLAPRTVKPGYA